MKLKSKPAMFLFRNAPEQCCCHPLQGKAFVQSWQKERSSTFTLNMHVYVEFDIGLRAQLKCKIISLSLLFGIAESSSLAELRLPQLHSPRSNQSQGSGCVPHRHLPTEHTCTPRMCTYMAGRTCQPRQTHGALR